MTSPEERRTKGRRTNLRKIWSSAEWKEKKAAFLADHPLCEMHATAGKEVPATLPHHPSLTSYKGFYTDLELSQCVPLCNKCHFAVHHGLKLCVKCGEHYHHWYQTDECHECFDKDHPEIVKAREDYEQDRAKKEKAAKEARNEKNREAKRKHPCKHRRVGGACARSVIGSRCPYSPTKAEAKCEDFEAKKGKKP